MKQAPKVWFKWEAIQKADGKAQCPTACTKMENNIQEQKGNYTKKKSMEDKVGAPRCLSGRTGEKCGRDNPLYLASCSWI